MSAMNEAGKDLTRTAIFGALSTVGSYILNAIFPTMPGEVQSAILVLLFAGLVYADSYIHNKNTGMFKNTTGIIPF